MSRIGLRQGQLGISMMEVIIGPMLEPPMQGMQKMIALFMIKIISILHIVLIIKVVIGIHLI